MPDSPDHASRWLATALAFQQLAESIPPTDWVPQVPRPQDAYADEDERHAARVAYWRRVLLLFCANALRLFRFGFRTVDCLNCLSLLDIGCAIRRFAWRLFASHTYAH